MAGCVPPEEPVVAAPPRGMPPWLATPLFVLGLFLIFYVSLGLPFIPPTLRIPLAVPGAGLVALTWRKLRAPFPSALAWGGLFFGAAGRLVHPALMVVGGVVAAVGIV